MTRDYVLRLDTDQGAAPVLSIFGGKITTYRRLAEHAIEKFARWFPGMGPAWTADAPLPGAAPPADDTSRLLRRLEERYPRLPQALLRALAGRHGTLAYDVLGNAAAVADLGVHFGAELYARELDYLVGQEWGGSAEDVLWRRTKAGLHLDQAQREAVACYWAQRVS